VRGGHEVPLTDISFERFQRFEERSPSQPIDRRGVMRVSNGRDRADTPLVPGLLPVVLAD
jgi:hypothetical protein